MIRVKTINNEVVKPMQTPDDLDKRKPRGDNLIPAPYANIYLCAKKRTGKSSVVAKMVMAFAGPETAVHIFCSTVFIDPTYIALEKWLDSKNIPYYPSTSIKDEDGHDLINDILKTDEDFVDESNPDAPSGLLDLSETINPLLPTAIWILITLSLM